MINIHENIVHKLESFDCLYLDQWITTRDYVALCAVLLLDCTRYCQSAVNNSLEVWDNNPTEDNEYTVDLTILDRNLADSLLELYESVYALRVNRGI